MSIQLLHHNMMYLYAMRVLLDSSMLPTVSIALRVRCALSVLAILTVACGFSSRSGPTRRNGIRNPGHCISCGLAKNSSTDAGNRLPKVIVFDLDGCLWRPEMYELLWQGSGSASPFSPIDDNDLTRMMGASGTMVELFADVPEILDELFLDPKWAETILALSSRTDEPNWAKELLQKMTLPQSQVSLQQVFTGPNEIAKDSKTFHFERIAASTQIKMEDILFLDNEFGNCRQISRLGVTVAHCPNGVTRDVFEMAIDSFPSRWGEIVQANV